MIWNEEDSKSLQSRLSDYRQEIIVHILSLIRYVQCNFFWLQLSLQNAYSTRIQGQQSVEQQEQVLTRINKIQACTERLEKNQSQEILSKEGIGAAFLNVLSSQVDSTVQDYGIQSLQEDLIAAIYQERAVESITATPSPQIPACREDRLREVFLERLRYAGMNDRVDRIAKAYEKTFQWIFEDGSLQQTRWSDFRNWLESDSSLYWITGKPGSGKSTLIKYICQTGDMVLSRDKQSDSGASSELRYLKHLKRWSGDSQIITATFFFWNSGIELQMSQEGLFLSLLYQILQQAPKLMSILSPKRWEALCLFDHDLGKWSLPELLQMLRTAAREISKTMKLCLFVDGLDEFEGEHSDLISLFRDLTQNENVKLCVASRPWTIFEDAFKHKPSMMLQDLTYLDIKHYVTSKFRDDSGFAQLQRREPDYADQLIENVVSKASGVFFWVHVVVTSLLAGMGFGDRISDLQKRLDLLPCELERLYDRILHSLDPFYLEHAAQLFKLVQAANEPPPLILLSFADEADLQPYIVREVKSLSRDELSLRADTMGRRLNSRCKGFLEVGTKPRCDVTEGSVQYLH